MIILIENDAKSVGYLLINMRFSCMYRIVCVDQLNIVVYRACKHIGLNCVFTH